MDVYELVGRREAHPVYGRLAAENEVRLHAFLESIIQAAAELDRPLISTNLINCLHVHAVAGLHTHMGEYRPTEVNVGDHRSELGPVRGNLPAAYRVRHLMDDFVNQVNRCWDGEESVSLSAYVLWRFNFIHPFINGNGRTSRALCYFVLCLKEQGLFSSGSFLPDLIKEYREDCISALRACDELYARGSSSHEPMTRYLVRILQRM